VLAAILGIAAGCSKSEPKTIQLSGKVTFNGQPVPAGYIMFVPDFSQRNYGQGTRMAQIKDGAYDSSTAENPGVHPGPTIIRIAGFDGKKDPPLFPQGRQIFNPCELRETLAAGTKDFEVPPSAAQHLLIIPTGEP
jgi:hypothetical protein